MKISLRDYWNIIYYNYEQIRFAEIKSSVILSVYSLFFTLAYTIDILDEENVYDLQLNSIGDYVVVLLIFPTLYFTIASFVSCVKCFLPRFKKSSLNSPLFFGDVAMGYKDFESYHEDLNQLLTDPERYKKHLSHMVYATSTIAFTKFRHVNTAIKSLIKSIVCFVVFLCLLYIL